MMEATVQAQSLKVTLKKKNDKNVGNSSTFADHMNNVKEERDASNSPNLSGHLTTLPEGLISAEKVENHDTEDDGNKNFENSHYQLVLYDPAITGGDTGRNTSEPISASPLQRIHPFSDRTPRVLPSVGMFTVQCAICFKWRLIPTKKKYEEIREHLVQQPFLCETAREWRPSVSCDDPPDIRQDGSRLWAIDKPNIPQPPPGWERLLRIRGEGSAKFADVYYAAPAGKKLRSMVEIQKYLDEHPEYMKEGVSLSMFSFQIPKPLQNTYLRKRPALPNNASDLGIPRYLPPPEGAPLSLAILQPGRRRLSNEHFKAPRPYPCKEEKDALPNWDV